MAKQNCRTCGKPTATVFLPLSEINKKHYDPEDYCCVRCSSIEQSDRDLNCVTVKQAFISKETNEEVQWTPFVIDIDSPLSKLTAFRIRKCSRPGITFHNECWEDKQLYDEVSDNLATPMALYTGKATAKQTQFINYLLTQKAINKIRVYAHYNIESLTELTLKDATELIDSLVKGTYTL